MTFQLLTISNPKVLKGQSKGYLSFILHLAPYNLSGKNVCAKATAGCIAGCLNTAGRGGMFKKGENTNVIQKARIRKTQLFFSNRGAFLTQLYTEIRKAIIQAEKKGLIPVFRLNGTSDIAWEKYEVQDNKNIFQMFPNVQFYDYTKILGRKVKHIPNYHLTFSRAESNEMDSRLAASRGMNVAVVFEKELPNTFYGRKVINGDESDLRFIDEPNVIVGLKAKGRAKKDTTGFVVRK